MDVRYSVLAALVAAALGACTLLVDTNELTSGDANGPADASFDIRPDDVLAFDASNEADAQPTYAEVVLADQPSLYYRFEDSLGATVKDEMGNHPGTVLEGTRFEVEGAFPGSRAIELDGTGGIRVGDVFDFEQRKPFSLETWFYLESFDRTFRFIFNNSEFIGGKRASYGVYVEEFNGLVLERYVNDTGYSAGRKVPAVKQWHHVVAVYDGTNLRLYLNGLESSSTVDDREAAPKTVGLFIGIGSSVSPALQGRLDEVAVYEKALSPERIEAHYLAGR